MARSHCSTSAHANVGLVGVPPTGCGKSAYRRRQFDTAALPTSAIRAISAAVTSSRFVVTANTVHSRVAYTQRPNGSQFSLCT
ncbi:hypothetical protein ACFQX7_33095 [Luedemannella flava]